MPSGKHLTLTEQAVIIGQRTLKKSIRTIAHDVKRCPSTVHKIIKKNNTDANIQTIRERVIQALNDRGLDDIGYADKCIELLNCKRYQLSPDGNMDLVPDNQTQAKVLNTVKDIMGLDAVKQSEVKHTIELSPAENDEIMIIRRRHNIEK